MTADLQAGVGAADVRSDVLRLASRLFSLEIDPPLYRRLLDLHAWDRDRRTADGPAFLDDHVAAMAEDDALEELAAEYCRLFIGPRPPCSPYASVHIGGGVLGTVQATAVDQLADRLGVSVEIAPGAPVQAHDHIGVVLALLADPATATDADGVMKRFVLPWVPAYLRLVEQHAHLNPYRTVATLVRSLLADEATGGAS